MKAASIIVQQKDHWKEHEKIKEMQFSNKWIYGFLKRGGLSRRKITRDDKDLPSDDEINKVLKKGQNCTFEMAIRPTPPSTSTRQPSLGP